MARSAARPIILTVDDYQHFPDNGQRWEIIHGEAYVTPAPSLKHQRISRNLEFVLHQHVRARGLGEVFDAPVDVYLGRTDVVQPDLVFVSRERRQLLSERGIEGAPDLVVEILSPSTSERDLGVKQQMYARYAIKHYWVVNPDAETLSEYRLEHNAYELAATYGKGDRLEVSLIEGLVVALDEVFE